MKKDDEKWKLKLYLVEDKVQQHSRILKYMAGVIAWLVITVIMLTMIERYDL